MPSLDNKKILLGVTGGIAAYKTPELVRLLRKAGAEVQVLMSPSAKQFVTAETLSVVSGNPVYSDFFRDNNGSWNNHVHFGMWADVFLIAPATANSLAKMANGQADNLLLATYLSAKCPVIVSPAMDLDMMEHPAVHQNLAILQANGVELIEAETGELASGLVGKGRMPEPETLVDHIRAFFAAKQRFHKKKVLVTAGPTYENLDPVRFIGNYSTGLMGYEIAGAFRDEGAEVVLVSGPTHLEVPDGVDIIKVTSAVEMLNACIKQNPDIIMMTAAVADYRPAQTMSQKIKKTDGELQITFLKNPDILATLGQQKKKGQWITGFALETENELEHANLKLKNKNADMIVLNSLNDAGAGFGHATNKVTFLFADGETRPMHLMSKREVAREIVHAIAEKTGL